MTPTKRSPEPAPVVAQEADAAPDPSDELAELVTALILGVIVLFRPWYDGLALAAYNSYFLWAQAALATLVCVRLFLRGRRLRSGPFIALFAGFLVIAVLTATDSTQWNNSYRSLPTWTGYLFVFVVAANGIRSNRAVGIVLGAFALTAAVEALYSVMHLKYYMPIMRRQVMLDPSLVPIFFGAPEITPEIARRLNTNRAFGSLLFPNALAGFMVMAVPFAIGAAAHTLRKLRGDPAVHAPATSPAARLQQAAAVGLCSWIAAFMAFFVGYQIFCAVAYPDQPMTRLWLSWLIYVGVVPAALAALLYQAAYRRGPRFAGWAFAAGALPAAALACFAALFYSYSRGGMLALIASLAATGALAVLANRRSARPRRMPARAAVAGVLLALAVWSGAHAAFREAAAGESAPLSPREQRRLAHEHPSSEVKVEGVPPSAQDIMDPATMMLRASYWRVGLRMFLDNPLTGVGLGNFGVMYPHYRHLGAGETRQAHNDFLQVFCETGVLGGILFAAFWAAVVLWGGRRLLRARRHARFWLMAGLYAGILAFLLHAVVDFNFFNPSLTTFVMLLAGLFLGIARDESPAPSPRAALPSRAAAAVLLLAVIVVMGASWRVHRADSLAGTDAEIKARYVTAQLLLSPPEGGGRDRSVAHAVPVRQALMLIPDRDALSALGDYWAHEPGRSPRRLGPHEPVTETAMLHIRQPEAARRAAVEHMRGFIERLERADAVFPHDPMRATHLYNWYDTLADAERDPGPRAGLLESAAAWALTALDRSPFEAWYHETYASALWRRAETHADPERRRQDLLDGLEHYRQATVLFPTKHEVWRSYGEALAKLAEAYRESGRSEQAAAFADQSAEAVARADEVQMAEYRANRRRAGLE